MGLFDALRGRSRAGELRQRSHRASAHLTEWAASRRGVEAYIEPRTMMTETTVVLVAHDGEWTRRRIASGSAARDLGHRLGIPVYDVALVGYPQRMRDYTARQNRANRHGRHENLEF
ncbi:MAG TPA: oxidoreductase [Pseudonocardiaceae bacterium]|jgi:hypothetical protein|nr:oxidoreductase [Pseudonocardiaceae bacterium]